MANLVELFDNIVQMQALNGVPLANGKLYVYALGRTRLMDTWSDVDGESLNTNPIILDDAGQAHVYVSDDFDYTLVVCDEYNNEVFSIDKYLYSKGEHSHADVAVAPSEHIGVSSYHVGETTVYVPYIQGELGKTYHGIEPIVVNNQENKISARNIPLGVQEPLYFVEDSESACVIGASGLAYQSSVDYVSGVVDTKYDTTAAEAALAQKVNSADFTAYQEDITQAFQDVSNDINFLSGAIVDVASGAHADIDFISGKVDTKLDTTAFSTVSGNFLTAHQSLSAYATTADVNDLAQSISETYQPKGDYQTAGDYYSASNPSGFITGVDLTPYMEASKLETADGKITGYDGTAFAGGGGSVDPSEFIPWSASGEFQESGNYYSASNPNGFINSDAISAMATTGFVADVSADITAMIPTALTGDYLTKDSADTLYYGIDNPSGFITGVDLTPYQTTAGMTAYQPVGDYLTTADSANFYTTANESGFITGVDLTPYQLTADMTAYQEAGDYYSASNPSGFITGVDLTPYQTTAEMTAYQPIGDYVQGSDLSLNSYDKISAISGHEIAVEELPEGVMIESGLEYDNTEISGYSGSAFKDVALTDVVTANSGVWGGSALPISAGPGIKFEMVDNTLVASTDETILYTGNAAVTSFTVSEPLTNFNEVAFYVAPNFETTVSKIVLPMVGYNTSHIALTYHSIWNGFKGGIQISTEYNNTGMTEFQLISGAWFGWANDAAKTGTYYDAYIHKIIGINRIAGE